MKRNIRFLFFLPLVFVFTHAKSDEGMWLPFLLEKFNYHEMAQMGLKLTPDQLYSINQASLKDAVVKLDGGSCTGEIISSQGLVLTNHHCGYDNIQEHSTTEHNYLADGFWAYPLEEELPNPGKTASFLIRIEDVTEKVLEDVADDLPEDDRDQAINSAKKEIINNATKGTHYEASIESMFNGNEFYLFVYETFLDVRLVGAPPSSIGNFGDDTDNWMWPRHTGDFSLFRIYTDANGKPAPYSVENKPFVPKKHLKVSMKGIQEGDFTMIWGYPGTTDRYLASYGVDLLTDQISPAVVKLRKDKMDIMKVYMEADEKVDIMLASKYSNMSNVWKKDKEQIKALKALKVYEQKKSLEEEFEKWASQTPERKKKYGEVIKTFADSYGIIKQNKINLVESYIIEATFLSGVDALVFSYQFRNKTRVLEDEKGMIPMDEEVRSMIEKYYKDFHLKSDKEKAVYMLQAIKKDLPPEFHPEIFKKIDKKYKGNFEKYIEKVFDKSIFGNWKKMDAFMAKPKAEKVAEDPIFELMVSLIRVYMGANFAKEEVQMELDKAKRLFVQGLRLMNPDVKYYPDANSTMRVTYGKVAGYIPRDAVEYDFITYLEGVMEKEIPDDREFDVPKKLKELYQKKAFGNYAENGKMPVCFLTDHDITGGNSGSPVIDAQGHLIGTAFDGNSEAMSSDIEFDENLQRTIVCDIRYVLFIIDKFAGAKNLVGEMDLVWN